MLRSLVGSEMCIRDSPQQHHQIPIHCWKTLAIKKLPKSTATPAWHLPTWKEQRPDKKLSRTTTREQPAKCSHYLCSCHCRASTSTGLSQIMLQHLSSWVPVTTCVEKAVYRSLSVQSPSQRFVEKQSTVIPATEPGPVYSITPRNLAPLQHELRRRCCFRGRHRCLLSSPSTYPCSSLHLLAPDRMGMYQKTTPCDVWDFCLIKARV